MILVETPILIFRFFVVCATGDGGVDSVALVLTKVYLLDLLDSDFVPLLQFVSLFSQSFTVGSFFNKLHVLRSMLGYSFGLLTDRTHGVDRSIVAAGCVANPIPFLISFIVAIVISVRLKLFLQGSFWHCPL